MKESNARKIATYYLLKCPEFAREMVLSKQQIEVYKWGRKREEFYSRQVCEAFKITIQHANTVLTSLYSKGYVNRHRVDAKTGGWEWAYKTKLK